MTTTTRPGTLYRACGSHHPAPWWHSSRDTAADPGRFDLVSPNGTCYWAGTPGAAILERIADPDQVDPPLATIAALSNLTVWLATYVSAAAPPLADATVASLPTLNGEIATIVPYDLTWWWADEFHDAGLAGIVYHGRFAQADCFALFAPSGPTADPSALLTRHPAIAMAERLPAAYRGNVTTVGTAASLPRAPAP
ncbi:RES family NAD+ phosphorylase [Nitriliruptor alkaliphilus]|uniref:RES family NAD+ phosphorylase n=1 Tax=Nitriliruptor alkaliphilus TaxID=427918 RepID=UPI0014700E34|nr:RES family NAD+ phosphorylase [Nitriliruptor alkaliphilus]